MGANGGCCHFFQNCVDNTLLMYADRLYNKTIYSTCSLTSRRVLETYVMFLGVLPHKEIEDLVLVLLHSGVFSQIRHFTSQLHQWLNPNAPLPSSLTQRPKGTVLYMPQLWPIYLFSPSLRVKQLSSTFL